MFSDIFPVTSVTSAVMPLYYCWDKTRSLQREAAVSVVEHQGTTFLAVSLTILMLQELLAVATKEVIADPASYRYLGRNTSLCQQATKVFHLDNGYYFWLRPPPAAQPAKLPTK
jgi:hypothetical protein